MQHHLVLTVRLHDGRYHGATEWPPAPARLYQALVAGAARGSVLRPEALAALDWLERLGPPVIAAPKAQLGSLVEIFVPNNDLDAEGGDPGRIANIRTKKLVRPHLFEQRSEFAYAWRIGNDRQGLDDILVMAEDLYQFGRGVDMAWACGEVIDNEVLRQRLVSSDCDVFLPNPSGTETELDCPTSGTLRSVLNRYDAFLRRIRVDSEGKSPRYFFAQPPKPAFRRVGYGSSCHSVLYELRDNLHDTRLWSWPLRRASILVERIRNAAAERLRAAMPEKLELVERCLIGRKAKGDDTGPIEERIRIVPLASIGHEYADLAIRRVLVEVPSSCPLLSVDVHWAFSGCETINSTTGEVGPFVLTEATDVRMLEYYAPRKGAYVWRSVTAVALPDLGMRRRIDPLRRLEEAKDASERQTEEEHASTATKDALRHARVFACANSIRVQREPFDAMGSQAEAFAEHTRFNKHCLWQVEITFDRPVKGPLVIGDGRFLGLGIMAPFKRTRDADATQRRADPIVRAITHQGTFGTIAFEIVEGISSTSDSQEIARALRRAAMARVQSILGERFLPTFFTGHRMDGTPARGEGHVAFVCDPIERRAFVVAPHILNRRDLLPKEEDYIRALQDSLAELSVLRAGQSGLLRLRRAPESDFGGSLFTPSRTWQSVTPYRVNRHAKVGAAVQAVNRDLEEECSRRCLPRPQSTKVTEVRGIAGIGLSAMINLEFAVAVSGPILLGRSRHIGGGVFRACSDADSNT